MHRLIYGGREFSRLCTTLRRQVQHYESVIAAGVYKAKDALHRGVRFGLISRTGVDTDDDEDIIARLLQGKAVIPFGYANGVIFNHLYCL